MATGRGGPPPGWYRRPDVADRVTYWDGTAFVDSMSGPLVSSAGEVRVDTGTPHGEYWEVARVEVEVGSAVVATPPTIEAANERLRMRAAQLGANAVIRVSYARGSGLASWRALRAEGVAVVFGELPERQAFPDGASEADVPDAGHRLRTLDDLHRSGVITEDEYRRHRERILEDI